ncbi:porin family protein [Pedobacter arcticus]|uniref:porin family protein n=1 Tax=Pedobacter arcticus TaxID=752140 RepID=UPI00030A7754|nr:porin family protein [Pedobacter arcticus]
MKKTLIMLFAVSLGFGASVNAQEAKTDKIKFGIKAGANLTTLGKIGSGANEYKYDYQPGFTAGIFTEIPLGGQFKFVPEVNYSQKGAKVEGTVSGVTGKLETKIDYLDVPIAFSYEAAPRFNVFAGPQVSFLLSQKTEFYSNGEKLNETTDTKDFAKTIAGGVVGLGYDFTQNLNVTGRYMRDFQKGTTNDDENFGKAKNSGFALTLGYKF